MAEKSLSSDHTACKAFQLNASQVFLAALRRGICIFIFGATSVDLIRQEEGGAVDMPQGNSGSIEIAVQMLRQLVCLYICLSVSSPVSSQIRFDQREREKSFTDLFALVRTETHIHPSILETSLLDSQEKQRKGRGRKGKQMK